MESNEKKFFKKKLSNKRKSTMPKTEEQKVINTMKERSKKKAREKTEF